MTERQSFRLADLARFGGCLALSLAVMTGVWQWLEHNGKLTSELALNYAQTSLFEFCSGHRLDYYNLSLRDVSPPTQARNFWQFSFGAEHSQPVTVRVSDTGKTDILLAKR